MTKLHELGALATQLTAIVGQMSPLDPQYDASRSAEAEAYFILSQAQWEDGDADSARTSLDHALGIAPHGGWMIRRAAMLPRIQASRQSILETRQELRDRLSAIAETSATAPISSGACGTLFLLAYHGEHGNRDLHRLYHQVCSQAEPALDWVAPHCGRPRRPGPPRVGFVSYFLSERFREHTVASLFRGLIGAFDGNRFDTTVFTFEDPATAPSDWSGKRRVAMPRDLAAAQRMIAAAELDVLVYLDLGMDNFTLFLAHARLAPCQSLLWGHPDTTGLDSMDVFLSVDCMEAEDGDDHYSETLVRLPGPGTCFPRPLPPAPLPDRAALGLPKDGQLLLCPQSPFKFHPDFDIALARILERVPDGRLVLTAGWEQRAMAQAKARIASHAPHVADRILVLGPLGRNDFRALFLVCDVVLDPFHYSGGHTTLEAFAFGAPVVTWPGRFMRARHTAGFYRLMGIDDAIARDHDHYVELAVDLTRQAARREALKARILSANHMLYDNVQSVRALEGFVADQVPAS